MSHSANAAAVEGGYQFGKAASAPWLRGGWFRSSGDNNATDGKHNTFFQILPTPRIYARDPFYNLMNSTDEFVQVMDKPVSKLALRGDLHWLQLTSGKDLWYQGGGAYDNKVFGYTGRPGEWALLLCLGRRHQRRLAGDQDLWRQFLLRACLGQKRDRRDLSRGPQRQYGYVELVYRWDRAQKGARK